MREGKGLVKRFRSIGWLISLILVTSCAPDPGEIYMSGSGVVPARTLQDWATYGDVAVRFRVISEHEVDASDEEKRRGEGTITRQVIARQTGAPFWERATRPPSEPPSPAEWTISDGGWAFNGSQRRRLLVGDRPALVVGQEYLAIRTLSTIGGVPPKEWFSLVYLPLDGSNTIDVSAQQLKDSMVDAPAIDNISPAALGKLLNSTRPDAKSIPYMELDAYERYQRTAR